VARASSLGFAVHAVAGGPNWTDASHRYLGPKLVQLVADYNSAAAPNELLQGVQFDIEPYVDPSFFNDVEASLVDYLSTLQGIVDKYIAVQTQAGNSRLRLGFAIPFWFDGVPEAPPVEYGKTDATKTTKAAAFHLIDMLQALPEAYVLVMAYRNFASGPDGSIDHVRSEFDYARQAGAVCGIVVGQEFTKVYPEKLSFWWAGRAAFRGRPRRSPRPTASFRSSAGCRSTTSTGTRPPGSDRTDGRPRCGGPHRGRPSRLRQGARSTRKSARGPSGVTPVATVP